MLHRRALGGRRRGVYLVVVFGAEVGLVGAGVDGHIPALGDQPWVQAGDPPYLVV